MFCKHCSAYIQNDYINVFILWNIRQINSHKFFLKMLNEHTNAGFLSKLLSLIEIIKMIFVSIIKSVAFLKFNVPTGFICYVYILADNQSKINCIGSKHTRTFQNLLANMHIKMVRKSILCLEYYF